MKILGVDPGTATTGWAVIDTAGRLLAGRSAGEKIPKVLGCGIITTRAKLPDFERLEIIYTAICDIIKKEALTAQKCLIIKKQKFNKKS